MATYYVTVNRPALDAATPEEAAQLAVTAPLEAEDQVFVKEVSAEGSMHIVPGAAAMLGGAVPQPDEIYKGPDMVPQIRRN